MNAHDRGWIEALIDGEGSLHIQFCLHKKKYKVYTPMLQIGNTNLALVKEAKRIIGFGRIHKQRPTQPRHVMSYRLTVVGHALRNFLPQIRLIDKERQRRLCVTMLRLTNFHTYHNHPNPNKKRIAELVRLVRLYNK